MHRHAIVALVALIAAIAPAAASAAGADADAGRDATTACKAEKHAMGTKVFKQAYAAKSTAKAMAACVAKREPAAEEDAKNAAQECKAERDADPAAFAEKYGTNKNKRNAYGKCVSGKAEEATEEETEARVNAAQTCKTPRRDDAEAFEEQYGTEAQRVRQVRLRDGEGRRRRARSLTRRGRTGRA